MMKFFKKITAATLAVAATLAMAVSCGGGGGSTSNNGGKESNTPDTSGKTQLNVGVFDAGLSKNITRIPPLKRAKRALPSFL